MIGYVAQLLADRLGARGETLAERVASRVRALPQRVRRAAKVLAEVEARLEAPKLMRQTDRAAVVRAYAQCVAWLEPLNAPVRIRNRLLDVAATVVFGLTAVALAGVALAH